MHVFQAWSLVSSLTVHEYFSKVSPFKLKKKTEIHFVVTMIKYVDGSTVNASD